MHEALDCGARMPVEQVGKTDSRAQADAAVVYGDRLQLLDTGQVHHQVGVQRRPFQVHHDIGAAGHGHDAAVMSQGRQRFGYVAGPGEIEIVNHGLRPAMSVETCSGVRGR